MGLRAKAAITPQTKSNLQMRRACNKISAITTTTATTLPTTTNNSKQAPTKSTSTTNMERRLLKKSKSAATTTSATTTKKLTTEATCITATSSTTTKTSTTYRSKSNVSLITTEATKNAAFATAAAAAAAAASVAQRPQTLNVHRRELPADQTQLFLGEVLNAWRAKARCNAVPAERTQELFHELSFHPSDKQISDMLQTAKMLARKGSRQSNGLTFGEFCVLAADLKRFRASTFCAPSNVYLPSSLPGSDAEDDDVTLKSNNSGIIDKTRTGCRPAHSQQSSTKKMLNFEDCSTNTSKRKISADSTPVEVFLGGSCNPTTWRADVAIPALKELGISFYNPQVSDWTPDLIELEHRAKEKARVLFFVMDSETRASAGAIEAAHIAGQNCKQLVLVLHPYKPNQYILNEPISQQEYLDLKRNQMLLSELVTRRGLPVLDNIPSALQRTKEILVGIRDPPSNIASILVVVRGAFNRVNPVNDLITVEKCQRALLYLGYAQSLVNLENLNKIIATQRESLEAMRRQALHNKSTESACSSSLGSLSSSSIASEVQAENSVNENSVDFELFCVMSAYLSVLQQEIHESGCISPIKGTNVPPPPVYLANMQGDENFTVSYYSSSSKNVSRTSSSASVPSGSNASVSSCDEHEKYRQCLSELLGRSRDSGTSSPQLNELPLKSKSATQLGKPKNQTKILVNFESIESTTEIITQTPTADRAAFAHPLQTAQSTPIPPTHSASTSNMPPPMPAEEESDSNDSVFSSSSSINSINCSNYGSDNLYFSSLDFRDVYLGGSCALRTKWRQDVAMPYLKSKGITFHMPALHESIPQTQLDLNEQQMNEASRTINTSSSFTMRTRRKTRSAHYDEDEITVDEESELSWSLPVRQRLFNPSLLDSSRVLLFVITNETRSLAPMTLAAHCIGLMYNVVLTVQMLPENCVIGNEKLTPAAIKDYNRGRSYLIDLAKRQGVPVFNDLKAALECTVEKVKSCNSRSRFD